MKTITTERECQQRDLDKQRQNHHNPASWIPPATIEDAEVQGWVYLGVIETWVPPDAPNPLAFGMGIRGIYQK